MTLQSQTRNIRNTWSAPNTVRNHYLSPEDVLLGLQYGLFQWRQLPPEVQELVRSISRAPPHIDDIGNDYADGGWTESVSAASAAGQYREEDHPRNRAGEWTKKDGDDNNDNAPDWKVDSAVDQALQDLEEEAAVTGWVAPAAVFSDKYVASARKGAREGRVVLGLMSPDSLIKAMPPLRFEHEGSLKNLRHRLIWSKEIDIPMIGLGGDGTNLLAGSHEGRHRAEAAKRLGMKWVPVWISAIKPMPRSLVLRLAGKGANTAGIRDLTRRPAQAATGQWQEKDHPRDTLGRFIDKDVLASFYSHREKKHDAEVAQITEIGGHVAALEAAKAELDESMEIVGLDKLAEAWNAAHRNNRDYQLVGNEMRLLATRNTKHSASFQLSADLLDWLYSYNHTENKPGPFRASIADARAAEARIQQEADRAFETATSFYRGTSLVEVSSYLKRRTLDYGGGRYDYTCVTANEVSATGFGAGVIIEYDAKKLKELGATAAPYTAFVGHKQTRSKFEDPIPAVFAREFEARVPADAPIWEAVKAIYVDRKPPSKSYAPDDWYVRNEVPSKVGPVHFHVPKEWDDWEELGKPEPHGKPNKAAAGADSQPPLPAVQEPSLAVRALRWTAWQLPPQDRTPEAVLDHAIRWLFPAPGFVPSIEDAKKAIALVGSMRAASGTWDESKVTRHPAGSSKGGRFARKHMGYGFGDLERELAQMRGDLDQADILINEQDRKDHERRRRQSTGQDPYGGYGYNQLEADIQRAKEQQEKQQAEQQEREEAGEQLTIDEDNPDLGPGTRDESGRFEPKYAVLDPAYVGGFVHSSTDGYTDDRSISVVRARGKESNPEWLNRDPQDARSYNTFGHVNVTIGKGAKNIEAMNYLMEAWNALPPYLSVRIDKLIVADDGTTNCAWFDTENHALLFNPTAYEPGSESALGDKITTDNMQADVSSTLLHEVGHSWFGTRWKPARKTKTPDPTAVPAPDLLQFASITAENPVTDYARTFKKHVPVPTPQALDGYASGHRKALAAWEGSLPGADADKGPPSYADSYRKWSEGGYRSRPKSATARDAVRRLKIWDDMVHTTSHNSYFHENFADTFAYVYGSKEQRERRGYLPLGPLHSGIKGGTTEPNDKGRRLIAVVERQAKRMRALDANRRKDNWWRKQYEASKDV